MDQTKEGLIDKYRIWRNDGQSGSGQKHELCDYFVLDLDCDEFAWDALEAYAMACEKEYPQLSADLKAKIENHYEFQ